MGLTALNSIGCFIQFVQPWTYALGKLEGTIRILYYFYILLRASWPTSRIGWLCYSKEDFNELSSYLPPCWDIEFAFCKKPILKCESVPNPREIKYTIPWHTDLRKKKNVKQMCNYLIFIKIEIDLKMWVYNITL